MQLLLDGGHCLKAGTSFKWFYNASRNQLTKEKMEIQSTVRGHHIYKAIWTPVIGEELTVVPEEGNDHDPHAVAILKDEMMLLSRILFFFLRLQKYVK